MSHHESQVRGADGRLVDRMLFFSDAVFAIVLTLLALELRAPEYEGGIGNLWPALAAMWSKFLAFGMSFALTALWWTVHVRMTRRLVVFDWPTAICNLLALACVTVLPFATSVFGENPNSLDTLQFYWWVSLATASAMLLLLLVSTRGGGKLLGGMSGTEYFLRISQAVAPVLAFSAGVYFCAHGMAWEARMAAFVMFPVMWLGRLVFRIPRAAKA